MEGEAMTPEIILIGNGRAYAPIQDASGVTWKEQGTMLIMRSSKNKTLGYVHRYHKNDYCITARLFGKQHTLAKNFRTQPAAKAALVRWWVRILRTEL